MVGNLNSFANDTINHNNNINNNNTRPSICWQTKVNVKSSYTGKTSNYKNVLTKSTIERAKVFQEADLMITLMCIVQEPRTAAPPQTPSPPTRRPSSSPLFWLNLGLDARVAEAYRRRKLAIPVLIPTHFVPAICRVFQYCW